MELVLKHVMITKMMIITNHANIWNVPILKVSKKMVNVLQTRDYAMDLDLLQITMSLMLLTSENAN